MRQWGQSLLVGRPNFLSRCIVKREFRISFHAKMQFWSKINFHTAFRSSPFECGKTLWFVIPSSRFYRKFTIVCKLYLILSWTSGMGTRIALILFTISIGRKCIRDLSISGFLRIDKITNLYNAVDMLKHIRVNLINQRRVFHPIIISNTDIFLCSKNPNHTFLKEICLT